MAASAGYGVTLYGGSASPAAAEIEGINSVTMTMDRESIDVSVIDTADDWRIRILGLKNCSISVEGTFDAQTQQNLIRTSHLSGASYFVRLLPDGTNGYEWECKVVSVEFGAGADGAATFSATLESTGDPTVV